MIKQKRRAFQAVMDSDLQALMAVLEEEPAVLRACDERRDSLLHVAAECSDIELMSFLVQRGIDVNVNRKSDCIHTPLHVACRFGRIDNVKWLLENGADLEAGTGRNATPLISAASRGNLELIQFLLGEGANVNASYFLGEGPGRQNMNAALIARFDGNEDIARYLEQCMARPLDEEDNHAGSGSITLQSINQMDSEMLEAASSAALGSLPTVLRESPPVELIAEFQRYLDSGAAMEGQNPLGADTPMAFGALFGNVLCKAFGWSWVIVSADGWEGLGVVDQEHRYLIMPLAFLDRLFSTPDDEELSPKLLFDCIRYGNLPDSSPERCVMLA